MDAAKACPWFGNKFNYASEIFTKTEQELTQKIKYKHAGLR